MQAYVFPEAIPLQINQCPLVRHHTAAPRTPFCCPLCRLALPRVWREGEEGWQSIVCDCRWSNSHVILDWQHCTSRASAIHSCTTDNAEPSTSCTHTYLVVVLLRPAAICKLSPAAPPWRCVPLACIWRMYTQPSALQRRACRVGVLVCRLRANTARECSNVCRALPLIATPKRLSLLPCDARETGITWRSSTGPRRTESNEATRGKLVRGSWLISPIVAIE